MRITAALTTLLAGGLLALTPSLPAAAEGGGTLLSLDGVTFSAAPEGAVFPPDLTLIPGSRHTGTVWVLNDSGRAAALTISVSETSAPNAAFIEHLTLQALTPQTTGSEPVALQSGATCTPLLEGEVMRPGSVTEVSITLALRDDIDNDLQGASADTSLMVSLSDPDAPGAAADCTPGGGIPLMPSPGRPVDSGTPSPTRAPQLAGDDGNSTAGSADGGPAATPGDAPPAGTAAPPSLGSGSPVLFPWIGLGAAVLVGGVIFGLRQWKGQRR